LILFGNWDLEFVIYKVTFWGYHKIARIEWYNAKVVD